MIKIKKSVQLQQGDDQLQKFLNAKRCLQFENVHTLNTGGTKTILKNYNNIISSDGSCNSSDDERQSQNKSFCNNETELLPKRSKTTFALEKAPSLSDVSSTNHSKTNENVCSTGVSGPSNNGKTFFNITMPEHTPERVTNANSNNMETSDLNNEGQQNPRPPDTSPVHSEIHQAPSRATVQWRIKTVEIPQVDDSSSETDDDDDLFNNRLRPNSVDVNPEGREISAIEGDQIYIGQGKLIQFSFWKYMLRRSHGVFIREMLLIFWDKITLVNRCIAPKKITVLIENRSPRKRLTPKKYKVLRKNYIRYLNEKYNDGDLRDRLLRDMNTIISDKIKEIRRSICEKIV